MNNKKWLTYVLKIFINIVNHLNSVYVLNNYIFTMRTVFYRIEIYNRVYLSHYILHYWTCIVSRRMSHGYVLCLFLFRLGLQFIYIFFDDVIQINWSGNRNIWWSFAFVELTVCVLLSACIWHVVTISIHAFVHHSWL